MYVRSPNSLQLCEWRIVVRYTLLSRRHEISHGKNPDSRARAHALLFRIIVGLLLLRIYENLRRDRRKGSDTRDRIFYTQTLSHGIYIHIYEMVSRIFANICYVYFNA